MAENQLASSVLEDATLAVVRCDVKKAAIESHPLTKQKPFRAGWIVLPARLYYGGEPSVSDGLPLTAKTERQGIKSCVKTRALSR